LEKIYRIRESVEQAHRAANLAVAAFEKVRTGNLVLASAADVASAIAALHADWRRYELGLQEVQLALALVPDGPKYVVQKANLLRVKMRCKAGLGNLPEAKALTSETANLLRSPEIPREERNRAGSAIGTLAATAWLAGAGDASAELLRESIQKIEKQGSSPRDRIANHPCLDPSERRQLDRR